MNERQQSGTELMAFVGSILVVVVLMAILALIAIATSGDDDTSAGDSALPDLKPIAELEAAPDDEVHVAYVPNVPPPIDRSGQREYEIRLEVLENVCPIDPGNGVEMETWGYRVEGDDEISCGAPGPVLRGRVGDMVHITLTNLAENTQPHNIDFHAVTGPGGGAAALTVAPGESGTIDVRLLYPGVFMYHCAFGDVPVHIMHGMYGMFIVDPEEPLPEVDHEWAIMQSEWYATEPNGSGLTEIDMEALLNEDPRYVVFNGTVGALAGDNALNMEVGQRARIYFVNEGLNLDSNFHPIGSHWDVVYPEGATHPANNVIRGSQTTLVAAGGGTVAEIEAQVPSTLVLVDHALSRAFYKGAIGLINITGEENPEIFSATPAGTPAPDDAHGGGGGGGTVHEVEMVAGAFTTQAMDDPSEFADTEDPADYSVNVLRIKAGDTVRFVNNDPGMIHTATAVDGSFDTGFIREGDAVEVTFDDVGEFEYFCTPHPWMRAMIIVEPA
jgi:nitrite reductase (NO-forming)